MERIVRREYTIYPNAKMIVMETDFVILENVSAGKDLKESPVRKKIDCILSIVSMNQMLLFVKALECA